MREYMLVADGSGPYTYHEAIIAARRRGVGISSNPSEELMVDAGYTKVIQVERPEGDVVTKRAVELREDGFYYRDWDVREFTEQELAQQFQQKKAQLQSDVNTLRDASMQKGTTYTFGEDAVGHVQLRDGDRANLAGLRLKAQELVGLEVTEPVMAFRVYENVTYPMTPAEVVAMTDHAFIKYNELLSQCWALKDQIDQAQSEEDLPEIPAELEF